MKLTGSVLIWALLPVFLIGCGNANEPSSLTNHQAYEKLGDHMNTSELGWIVEHDDGVCSFCFDDFEIVDNLPSELVADDEEANGYIWESIVRAALIEQGSKLEVNFDSESSMFAGRLANKESAVELQSLLGKLVDDRSFRQRCFTRAIEISKGD